jgi:ankyrin repeat protein
MKKIIILTLLVSFGKILGGWDDFTNTVKKGFSKLGNEITSAANKNKKPITSNGTKAANDKENFENIKKRFSFFKETKDGLANAIKVYNEAEATKDWIGNVDRALGAAQDALSSSRDLLSHMEISNLTHDKELNEDIIKNIIDAGLAASYSSTVLIKAITSYRVQAQKRLESILNVDSNNNTKNNSAFWKCNYCYELIEEQNNNGPIFTYFAIRDIVNKLKSLPDIYYEIFITKLKKCYNPDDWKIIVNTKIDGKSIEDWYSNLNNDTYNIGIGEAIEGTEKIVEALRQTVTKARVALGSITNIPTSKLNIFSTEILPLLDVSKLKLIADKTAKSSATIAWAFDNIFTNVVLYSSGIKCDQRKKEYENLKIKDSQTQTEKLQAFDACNAIITAMPKKATFAVKRDFLKKISHCFDIITTPTSATMVGSSEIQAIINQWKNAGFSQDFFTSLITEKFDSLPDSIMEYLNKKANHENRPTKDLANQLKDILSPLINLPKDIVKKSATTKNITPEKNHIISLAQKNNYPDMQNFVTEIFADQKYSDQDKIDIINAQENKDNTTALFWFTYHKNLNAITFLLNNGAAPSIHIPTKGNRKTPLWWAIYLQQDNIIKVFFDASSETDLNNSLNAPVVDGNTALEMWIKTHPNQPDIFKVFGKNTETTSVKNSLNIPVIDKRTQQSTMPDEVLTTTKLVLKTHPNQLDIFKVFWKNTETTGQIRTEQDMQTAKNLIISFAQKNNFIEMKSFITEIFADKKYSYKDKTIIINAQESNDNTTALFWFTYYKNLDAITFLLNNGAAPSIHIPTKGNRKTPLWWAINIQQDYIIKAFFDASSEADLNNSLNAPVVGGTTALEMWRKTHPNQLDIFKVFGKNTETTSVKNSLNIPVIDKRTQQSTMPDEVLTTTKLVLEENTHTPTGQTTTTNL